MKCIIKQKSGRVAFLTFRDHGGLQGRVIPVEKVKGHNLGEAIELSRDVLDEGIEHGLDFSAILTDDITITPTDITQALRSHGVWTQKDLEKKASAVSAAIASLVGLTPGKLIKAVRDAIGRR